jgi:hypothetical protein
MVKVVEGEKRQFFVDAMFALQGSGRVSFDDIGELFHMPEVTVRMYYIETKRLLAKEVEEHQREKRDLVNPIRVFKDWPVLVEMLGKRLRETSMYPLRQKRLGKIAECLGKKLAPKKTGFEEVYY